MFKNNVILVISITFNSKLLLIKGDFDNEDYNKYHQEVGQLSLATGQTEYQCESRSFFKNISRYYNEEAVFNCDSMSTGLVSQEQITGYTDRTAFSLNAINNNYGFTDRNGNESYTVLGTIPFGPCAGDNYYISHINKVSSGSCASPFGVTQVKSIEAIYLISGKCESTCAKGINIVNYSPGKLSIVNHN